MSHLWSKFLHSFLYRKLEGRQNLQKILSNIGWLFVDKILRMGIGLLVGVWVARYLGPEQFGILNYASAFVGLFTAIATLGLDLIIIRNIVSYPLCKGTVLGTAFLLKLGGGMLAFSIVVGTITLLRPGEPLILLSVTIMAIGMVFRAFDVISFWFDSQMQSKYTVFAQNIAFFIGIVIRVLLILSGASLLAFVWTGLVETIFAVLGLLIVYRITGGEFSKWNVRIFKARELLKDGWPLLLSGIVVMTYMKIDMIMLGEMIGEEAVGVYGAATRISEVWYFIPITIVSSLSPIIINSKKVDETLYLSWLQNLYIILTLLGISIALPVTFLANNLITLLYGNVYSDSGSVLSIHIWASIAVFLGVASSQYLLAENLTNISFYRTSLGMLSNVSLNFILIPSYGAKGAAIATLVSYFIATFSLVFFKKTRMHAVMLLNSFNPLQWPRLFQIYK